MPFIDYSDKATPEFKDNFTKLYGQYVASANSRYYSLGIGVVLSALLTNLNTSLEIAKVNDETRFIVTMINTAVTIVTGVTAGVSTLVKSAKQKEVNSNLSTYPHFFNKPPLVNIGEVQTNSLAKTPGSILITMDSSTLSEPLVTDVDNADRINALKRCYQL